MNPLSAARVEAVHNLFVGLHRRGRGAVPGAVERLEAQAAGPSDGAQVFCGSQSFAEGIDFRHSPLLTTRVQDASGFMSETSQRCPDDQRSLADMDARETLAGNIARLIQEWADAHNRGKRSLLAWATAHQIEVKTAQRAYSGKHATNFDSLQHLADRIGVSPWELLHPKQGPSPRAREIAALFDGLPNEAQRARAYALITQILEFGNIGSPGAS